MMILSSNWDHNKIENAKKAFNNRENDYITWLNIKKKYYKFFVEIKKLWDDSGKNRTINTYDELFK